MNPRLAAAKALAAVLNGKASLNSSLPTQLDKVEDRDRGFTQDLAFGTARWQPRLSALAAKLLQKPFKAADADVEALTLVNAAAGADKALIADVRVFDEFIGGALGEGKKSLAVTVRLQPTDKTLKDTDIEAVSARIVEKVTNATGGTLRG